VSTKLHRRGLGSRVRLRGLRGSVSCVWP
jgi:hypothetical protein